MTIRALLAEARATRDFSTSWRYTSFPLLDDAQSQVRLWSAILRKTRSKSLRKTAARAIEGSAKTVLAALRHKRSVEETLRDRREYLESMAERGYSHVLHSRSYTYSTSIDPCAYAIGALKYRRDAAVKAGMTNEFLIETFSYTHGYGYDWYGRRYSNNSGEYDLFIKGTPIEAEMVRQIYRRYLTSIGCA